MVSGTGRSKNVRVQGCNARRESVVYFARFHLTVQVKNAKSLLLCTVAPLHSYDRTLNSRHNKKLVMLVINYSLFPCNYLILML